MYSAVRASLGARKRSEVGLCSTTSPSSMKMHSSLARRVSDECIFMLLGRVIEHSRTSDLFLSPKDPRTGEYIEGRYG